MADSPEKRIIEAVGFIGVVGSLIFVGLEVRQNSISIRAATNAAVAETYVAVNLAMASSPELSKAMARNAVNPEGASVEDKVQILSIWRALFHTWSNVHRQHINGTIDPAIYQSVVQEASVYAGKLANLEMSQELEQRAQAMRWAWANERFLFNPDFQVFVDGILATEKLTVQ